MKITIHQPEHAPWLGYFDKMARVDYYVFLDNVQFKKNDFQNRNRFIDRRTGKEFWLTVPVIMKNHTQSSIKDIDIDYQQRWQKKYWGRLYDCYCKYPYFKVYAEELEAIIKCVYCKLVNLNFDLIEFVRRQLRIEVPLIKASGLHVAGRSSELLLNICLAMKADVYLSGPHGMNYLDEKIFTGKGIRVKYHYPICESRYYKPYLSILDCMFKIGNEKTRELIQS